VKAQYNIYSKAGASDPILMARK